MERTGVNREQRRVPCYRGSAEVQRNTIRNPCEVCSAYNDEVLGRAVYTLIKTAAPEQAFDYAKTFFQTLRSVTLLSHR